jgi:hypothetical protein
LRQGCATHFEAWGQSQSPLGYSLNLSDYMPMCSSCHSRYDMGKLTL